MEKFPRPATWSLQQAAEKYLKALLLHLDKNPPRSHDLLFLLSLTEKEVADDVRDAAAELNAYSPTRRYPGDMPEINLDEAKNAKSATEIVRIWVMQHLESREAE